jgi:hypothetical protein
MNALLLSQDKDDRITLCTNGRPNEERLMGDVFDSEQDEDEVLSIEFAAGVEERFVF